jgi:hypothetical protein
MTFTMTIKVKDAKDRHMLDQLNVYCNEHKINLIVGQSGSNASLYFNGTHEAIRHLKAYLDKR